MNFGVDSPPQNNAFNKRDKPDWHGDKAKRERQRTIRVVSERAFVLGMAATTVLILLGIIVATRIQSGIPVNITVAAINPSPLNLEINPSQATQEAERILNMTQTSVHNELVDTMVAAAETATAFPSPTSTLGPTHLPPTPTPLGPTQLVEYRLKPSGTESDGLPRLTEIRVLPVKPISGYVFGGARVGPDGYLYVAHSRDLDITACNANEAYWIIDTQNGQKVDQIADASLVSPKRIAFDSAHNAYVLAVDCKQRAHAIFKFDAQRNWVDTFPIIGGDDLAITGDDRILVAISGFADNSVPQPHLIELQSDLKTGKLFQVMPLNIGDIADGHYRSILILSTGTQPEVNDLLYLIWAGSASFDQIQSIELKPATAIDTLSDSALQTDPIYDVVGRVQIDNLALADGNTIVGLSLDQRHIAQFQSRAGQVLSFPIPGMVATSFAIDPVTQYWFMTGQPEK